VEKRVMGIFGVEKDVIYSKGRRKIQVDSSKKYAVLLGRVRAWPYRRRISQAPWDNATCGELCGHPRRANRQREELQFSLIIYLWMSRKFLQISLKSPFLK